MTIPSFFASSHALSIIPEKLLGSSACIVWTPQISANCRAVILSGERPIIGTVGLSLAALFAVAPDLVYVKIALARTVLTTCDAAELIASEVVSSSLICLLSKICLYELSFSTPLIIPVSYNTSDAADDCWMV